MASVAAVVEVQSDANYSARELEAHALSQQMHAELEELVVQEEALRQSGRLRQSSTANSDIEDLLDQCKELLDAETAIREQAISQRLQVGMRVERMLRHRRQQLEALRNTPPVRPPAPAVICAPPPRAPVSRAAPSASPSSLQLSLTVAGENNLYVGWSNRLGVDGGVFVETVDILPHGSPVSVAIRLPWGQVAQSIGRVHWTRQLRDSAAPGGEGMGVQFEQLSAEAEQLLVQHLAYRDPIFYADD